MLNLGRVRSWQQADAFLGAKNERPAGNNTRLERRDDGAISVKYHGHAVVVYFPPGASGPDPVTVLNSCGWRTTTTKERLNEFGPAGFRVWQQRGTWYITQQRTAENDGRTWVFADGLTIDSYGQVFNAAPDSEAGEAQKLARRIRAYAKKFAAELIAGKVPAPSSGDCWICLGMLEREEHDTDHLDSHLEEEYFVPSLLVKAINAGRISLLSRSSLGQLWTPGQDPLSTWQQELLTRDVVSCLVKYLKHAYKLAA